MGEAVGWNGGWGVGRGTLTKEPSMKAQAEPRVMGSRNHLRVAWNVDWRVGRATLTTEPSMKAKAEPRMMAIRIHLRSDCAQGVGSGVAPTWVHGGTTWD